MVGGSYYWQSDREKRKNVTEEVKKKRAEEKKDRWIKELERRDEEDKAVSVYVLFLGGGGEVVRGVVGLSRLGMC